MLSRMSVDEQTRGGTDGEARQGRAFLPSLLSRLRNAAWLHVQNLATCSYPPCWPQMFPGRLWVPDLKSSRHFPLFPLLDGRLLCHLWGLSLVINVELRRTHSAPDPISLKGNSTNTDLYSRCVWGKTLIICLVFLGALLLKFSKLLCKVGLFFWFDRWEKWSSKRLREFTSQGFNDNCQN